MSLASFFRENMFISLPRSSFPSGAKIYFIYIIASFADVRQKVCELNDNIKTFSKIPSRNFSMFFFVSFDKC